MARSIALQAFLKTAEGQTAYDRMIPILTELYKTVEPHRFRQAAHDAAIGKIERESFRFPDFSVWALEENQAACA